MNKRRFLKRVGCATMAAPFFGLSKIEALESDVQLPYPKNKDENFWNRIRMDYRLKPDYINLENGYYNFIPTPILNKYLDRIKEINYQGSYYMRTVQWDNKQQVTQRLATLVNCPSDQLMITRNTTESLDLIIGGYPWKRGDEAVFALQDYGSMRLHFYQQQQRYGIVCNEVSIPNHPMSDAEIVNLYESKITPKTKLLMVSHMINITGQILPIKKICEMAHSYGVEVMVDGAHAVAHIQVDILDLGCDYYGSSLHKWLSAPLGAGLLYVNKKHISKIWPLFAEGDLNDYDIRRLNHTGTHPVHTDLAILDAMDYLEIVGLEDKEKRLRDLQTYWTAALGGLSRVILNTPTESDRVCGIANVGIENITPSDLAKILLEEFKIWTVAIDYANVKGCRITPNIYTTKAELDAFISAVKIIALRN